MRLCEKSATLLFALCFCAVSCAFLVFSGHDIVRQSLSPTFPSLQLKSRHVGLDRRASRSARARSPVSGIRNLAANLPEGLSGKERLEKFLEDSVLLGPMRFVSLTDGAILEAVGSFDNLRYSDLPKGRFATCSEGSGFECHLNTDKIKSIQMATKESPKGDHNLYITRFLDGNGDTVLSAMLHGVDGAYEPGATDYWEKLRNTFGADQSVA